MTEQCKDLTPVTTKTPSTRTLSKTVRKIIHQLENRQFENLGHAFSKMASVDNKGSVSDISSGSKGGGARGPLSPHFWGPRLYSEAQIMHIFRRIRLQESKTDAQRSTPYCPCLQIWILRSSIEQDVIDQWRIQGGRRRRPLRVQILSFWHTNFSKRSHLRSWHPPTRSAPSPMGNPGSANVDDWEHGAGRAAMQMLQKNKHSGVSCSLFCRCAYWSSAVWHYERYYTVGDHCFGCPQEIHSSETNRWSCPEQCSYSWLIFEGPQ